MTATVDTTELARRIRLDALRMVARAKASHIGTCLSMADLLACLYGRILHVDPSQPGWPERDRFILSKGHGAAILYAVLAEQGFFPLEWLETYAQNGSLLMGHASAHGIPGVEVSTGSLGHGLPIACGMALAAKRCGLPWRVFVLLGDGEMNEGSNWEAMLLAAHHKLDNLIAIVDHNKIQSFGSVEAVLNLAPLAEKCRAFGWGVEELDGHDHGAVLGALSAAPRVPGTPTLLVAHTVKGKGVSFMEGQLAWHYKSPGPGDLERAVAEVLGAR